MNFWKQFDKSLRIIEPNGPCPVESTRPLFQWTHRGITRREFAQQLHTAGARFRLRLWQINADENVAVRMARRPTRVWTLSPLSASFRIPKQEPSLRVATGYAWQITVISPGNRVLVASKPGVFYVNDPSLPFSLTQLLCCDSRIKKFGWVRAYGKPMINANESGFLDRPGVAQLRGNWVSGDAISHQLTPRAGFRAGRIYTISLAARAVPRERTDVRFRLLAHSAELPDTALHAASSSACILLAETGGITAEDWQWIVLPPWRAPRDFSYLSILAFANPRDDDSYPRRTPAGVGQVSSICIREVDSCEAGVKLANKGPEFHLPRSVELNTGEMPPYAEFVSSDLGAMGDIFGDPFDKEGKSRWYKEGDKCASIGGWLPDDLIDHVPWSEGGTGEFMPTFEEIQKSVKEVLSDLTNTDISDLSPISLTLSDSCRKRVIPFDADQDVIASPPPPFAGRDIVFVHGFLPKHLLARYIQSDPYARQVYDELPNSFNALADELNNIEYEWPMDRGAYLVQPADTATGTSEQVGFFRATDYWDKHIDRYLGKHKHPNRFIVTGWNSSQRLIFSVHAVLAQIAEAMNNGAGVRSADANQKVNTDCFGVEYAIVSHSTGALLVCVAMAIAERSKDDPQIQAIFGDISIIAERAKVHLSLHGAVGGSDLASLGLVAVQYAREAINSLDDDSQNLAQAASKLATSYSLMRLMLISFCWGGSEEGDLIGNTLNIMAANLTTVAVGTSQMRESARAFEEMLIRSVAVDLDPHVARSEWLDDVSASPVPTLTVAGGHPTAMPPAKPVLHGLDDGVVNTNSQSGSNSPMPPADPEMPLVDTYVAASLRQVYDMGLPIQRAAPFFIEQAVAYPKTAYGSIPFLSPSGMVQPVVSIPNIPRHNNHFTFLQATAEHGYPTDGKSELYEPTLNSTNYEESLVVERVQPYTAGLVNSKIITFVRRFERRLDVTMRLSFWIPQITISPPSFTMRYVDIPITQMIWRRFYDLLTTYKQSQNDPPLNSIHEVNLLVNLEQNSLPSFTVDSATNNEALGSDPLIKRQHEMVDNEHIELGECSWAYRFVLPS